MKIGNKHMGATNRVPELYRKEEEFKNNFRVPEKILNSSDSWFSLPVLGAVLQFESALLAQSFPEFLVPF